MTEHFYENISSTNFMDDRHSDRFRAIRLVFRNPEADFDLSK